MPCVFTTAAYISSSMHASQSRFCGFSYAQPWLDNVANTTRLGVAITTPTRHATPHGCSHVVIATVATSHMAAATMADATVAESHVACTHVGFYHSYAPHPAMWLQPCGYNHNGFYLHGCSHEGCRHVGYYHSCAPHPTTDYCRCHHVC